MTKINKEEYEILKNLDEKWKWIAKDDNYGGFIFCFREKPHKDIRKGGWSPDTTQYKCLWEYDLLFQFIQWKDEEPHNIAELIEEYEHKEFYDYVGWKYAESEEEEVKKDIEWLKREIPNLRGYAVLIDGEDGEWEPVTTVSMEDIYELINQLDKLEVLSQEFIENNSVYASSDGATEEYVHVDDLKELLVPKQELPVIPKFVADWVEEEGGYYKPSFLALGYDLYSNNITYPEVDKWIADNQELFARAWLDGFTVEKEQKYVVELPNPNNQLGRHKNVFLNKKDGEVFIDSASLFVNDITKYGQFALTEEEIKKDFEWAWAFAKPVKELEE